MIAGPRTVERSRTAPGLHDHAPVALRVDELAVDAGLDAVEDQAVGLEHVVEAAGVLPPALHDVRLDALAGVDEVLDRVGDLELAARADGSIARAASWIRGVNM